MPRVSLRIVVGPSDSDEISREELAADARRLARDLELADYLVEDRPDGPSEAGARGPEWLEIGIVTVQVAAETGALRALAERVKHWLGRNEVADIEIALGDGKLRIEKATNAQIQQLIDQFVAATSQAK
jgi:hypothetical protein